ncbi:MAG TPA: hypothetical protein PKY31_14505 [Spirochaetota bacterium]|nr:hypothetical protein [Spirochaetota bacterium]
MKKIALFAAFLLAFSVVSCTENDTYSVSVLMINSGAGTNYGYVKLVDADGNCTQKAQYWGRAQFSSNQALVTIEQVGSGSYFACVFIDTDGNAGTSEYSSPDSGDLWFDTADNVEVKDDIYITVNEGDWSAYL